MDASTPISGEAREARPMKVMVAIIPIDRLDDVRETRPDAEVAHRAASRGTGHGRLRDNGERGTDAL